MSEAGVRCIESVMLQDEGTPAPFELKRCIGCGSDDFKITGGIGLPVDVMLNGRIFQQPYRMRLCDDCGLIYKSHILNVSARSFIKLRLESLCPPQQSRNRKWNV